MYRMHHAPSATCLPYRFVAWMHALTGPLARFTIIMDHMARSLSPDQGELAYRTSFFARCRGDLNSLM